MRERPVTRGIAVACVAAALVAAIAQTVALVRYQRFSSALDAGASPETGRPVEVSWSFPFERSRPRSGASGRPAGWTTTATSR